ncbi:uncharacterized protein si:ch1073-15f19.2 isoform X1 [Nothobranchius furzeri]|uniref:LOC107386966-like protein n=3 Tax=Nothobranchius furzeri TaxID=105023 RepID=A0A9D3BG13_NOTFU|nr:putative LOC107386966-like protein [Nothobranchius furzeri]
MTGKVLGIAFHLLLFSSVIQGLKHVELIHKEAVEAVEGQNVSLPCLVKNVSGLNVVSLEWKKDETKLGMYNSAHGHYYHWSNVTIQIKQDEAKKLSGSHLLLLHVNKWDSGVYVCEITSFPLGSFRKETNLTVKEEIKLACEVDGGIEVNYGENALIHCSVSSNDAQYRWTKNENVVSDDASLKLWSVTGAHAGAYKLTVNTGGKTLHRVFTIVVLSATTDPVTTPEKSLTDSAHCNRTTFQSTKPLTPGNLTTPPNLSNVPVTAMEDMTSSTSIPSPPNTHSNSTDVLNSTASYEDTTEFRSTQEMTNKKMMTEATPHTPEPAGVFSESTEESSTVGNIKESSEHPPNSTSSTSIKITEPDIENKGTRWSQLFLALIIVSLLLVIVVVGILKMRQIRQKRMDFPPPFKPPPPPVKYTAAHQYEFSMQPFPISRCNSIIDPKDIRTLYT